MKFNSSFSNIFLISFIIQLPFIGFCQNAKTNAEVDSLKRSLIHEQNDTIYGEALTSIAGLYFQNYSDSIEIAEKYAEEGLEFGRKKKLSKIEADSHVVLGGIWRDKLDKQKSLDHYQSAYDIYKLNGSDKRAIQVRGDMATTLITFGEIEEAVKIKLENIRAFEEQQDSTSLLVEYYGVGYAYSSNQRVKKALPYFLKASTYADHPLVLGTIGRHYSTLGKTDSAFYYLNRGMEVVTPGSSTETDLLQKLGNIYLENNQYGESIVKFEKSLDNIGRDSELELANRIRGNLAFAYTSNNQVQKAKPLFDKLIFDNEKKSKNNRYWEIAYTLLEAEGKHKKALYAYKQFKESSDSLNSADLNSRIEEIETRYETEKKDNEIANLELKDQLNQKSIHKQKKALIGTGLGLSIFGMLSFFLYRLYKTNRDQKNQLSKVIKQKDTLLREIHHRVKNNLQLVSSLLTLQSRSIDDKSALDAINAGKSRVKSMALIHQDLYVRENITGVNVKSYLEKLCRELFDTYNIQSDNLSLVLDIDNIDLDVDTIVPLGLIINELVTNSLKYAFPNNRSGKLEIKLKQKEGSLNLQVSDDGVGYDEIKISGNSFGSTLVNTLTDQLGGKLKRSMDNGTHVNMVFEEYKLAS